jgi:hypothetical protein
VGRRIYLGAAVAVGFVLVLLYATFRYTPTPLGQSSELRLAAARECQRAVREGVPDARFPIGASVKGLDGGRLQLSGSVDSGRGSQTTRRNYDCFLSFSPSTGEFVTDSVEVWQSH